jgi:hypothetical protein
MLAQAAVVLLLQRELCWTRFARRRGRGKRENLKDATSFRGRIW